MNKRKLHHYYVKLKLVSPLMLLALFLVSLAVSVLALRNNNLQMIRLREAVFVADEKGEGVEGALNDLRSYVYGHMNTDLSSGPTSIKPPIQLKYTYERLTEAEDEKVAQKNQEVTAQATTVCEARHPAGQIQQRARCVQAYITNNTVQRSAEKVPKELYQFDFVSPRWSPDFAGFSVVITVLLFILLIMRVVIGRLLKNATK